MEEDAGKSIHDEEFVAAGESMIDINRCGVPLIEIVSEPDIATPQEATDYLTRLRQMLIYTEVSEGDMEKGHIRIDANVSIRPKGSDQLGTKVEIKNMNSIRNCQRALEAEIKRQIDIVETGGEIHQETRLYDADRDQLRSMRTKEESDDYRYFPDPDLVPILIDKNWVQRAREQVPELPEAKRQRFATDYELNPEQLDTLTASRDIADYFEGVVTAGADPAPVASWIQGNVRKTARNLQTVSPEHLARLLALLKEGKISGNIANTVFDNMVKTGETPETIVEQKDLVQISDEGALEDTVADILSDHPDEAERYRAGAKNLLGFFMGQIMKATQGKANPQLVNQLLRDKLDASG